MRRTLIAVCSAGFLGLTTPALATHPEPVPAPDPSVCPAPTPFKDTAGEFEIDRLEGRRLRSARRLARRHDCQVRVVKRDGRWLAVTEDYSPSRINVAVRDGRVRRAISVG